MHFIVTTDAKKADPETQKFIRRQVMMGKNRGNSHRAKKRRATTWAISGESRTVARKRGPPVPSEAMTEAYGYNSALPRRVGSDLSFVKLATEMDSAAFGNVIRFLDVRNRASYPLVLVTGLCKKGAAWFNPLEFDAACLHVIMFAAEVFRDKLSGRSPQSLATSQEATVHFLKGVQILRERLSTGDENTHSSDSTIAAVLTLAMTALLMGEDETFKHHMNGVRKMVDLRGGIAAFKGNKLLSEMFR
ncbi:hypothetical protein A1O1_01551 [Capronia coronata CBS 617.96]|uniref:Transcription factor domain-containing protein n=1 Tax=Capronia coronata CBS 617.96 TaxID=1182541 RepID=W9Z3A2_9EURO|nr:uncharacterized protein A1O1_01551 [Capronia coronata CBS 617.96]EXJ96425.1 hypothetical protein A1O1_01551 [Capronia coronata CBS 617.96]